MSRIFVSPRLTLEARALPIQHSSAKVSATWTKTGSRTVWIVMESGRHAHELLAEIPALQHAHKSRGRILQALGDVLAILDASFLHPLRHVADEVTEVRREVGDDEAADRQPLGQH